MSSAGATLQGSFSGETGTISETGFYYGTTSGDLGEKVSSGSTTSPFSKAITGLTANTTYYYKAYVIEGGQEVLDNSEAQSFTTEKAPATSVVTTSAASQMGATTVTLNGSYTGATGTVYDRGFEYRVRGSGGDWIDVGLNSTTAKAETYSMDISYLAEGTEYEFRAYVAEWNDFSGEYEYRRGGELYFSTRTSGSIVPTYLDGYGIPDVSGILSGTGTSGTYAALNDHWFRYNTNNNQRQIAVHTYLHPTSNAETVNYIVLYDGNRYAPVWTAHTMNTTYWPDNGASRSDDWIQDPAISLTQVDGLNDNSEYSRGHFVAANYRKSSSDQIGQTFYYTNKAPQWQNGFNSGVWSSLEARVKAMAPSGDNSMLYVITGVLYEGALTYKPKGNLSVPLPSHFYKCIMKCTLNGSGDVTAAEGIAFVYTNASHSGESYYSEAFVTSIDAIEKRAGFNFFASVPTLLQAAAESNTDHTWFTPSN